MRRLLIALLVLTISPPALADQGDAARKILSALKLQELFRYRVSKDYLKDGMRLADEARSPELWMAGAQLYAIAMSLTGDHASALDVTNEALRRISANPALKPSEETFTEFAGVLEYKLKRPEAALVQLQKLRAMQVARSDRKGELGTLHHMAYAYAAAGDYPNCLQALDTILSERTKLDPEVVPQVIQSQAKFLQEIGEHKKALDALTEALKLVDGLLAATPEPKEPSVDTHFKTLDQDPAFPERHKYRGMKANRAEILALLGSYYDFAGDYDKALEWYQKAVDLEKSLMISGTRKDELFDIARRLIIIHKKLGNLRKAFDIIGAVKTLAEKNDIPTNDLELTYGEFLLFYINHPEHGKESTRKAIDIFQRNDRPDLLGVVALKLKNYTDAKAQFARALKKALYSREADKLVGTHMGAGLAAEGLGDLAEAERYLNKAIGLMENQRDTLNPADRAGFFSGEVIGLPRTMAYEALVRVYLKQKNFDAAFLASENIKARRLAEAIAAGRSFEANLPPAERAREADLDTKITTKVRELELAFKRKDNAGFERTEGELTRLRSERDVFVEGLRKTNAAYAAIRYPRPLLPTDLWIGQNEALVEFEVMQDELFVFIISNGKSRVVRREIDREKLRAQVNELRDAFQQVGKADDLARFDPEKAAALYKTLFDGVLDDIPATTSLLIVPDEFLAVLPFDALVTDGKSKKTGQNEYGPFPLGVTYFGEKRVLRYAQSGTSLSIARALATGSVGKRVLVEADPVFSANDKRALGAVEDKQVVSAMSEWKKMGVAGMVTRAEGQAQAQGQATTTEVFPRLEKTSLLAERLRATFGSDANIYTGQAAREDTVKKSDLRDYRFVLFATHGILDDTLPYVREPALVLSLVNNPAGDDGFLTASEVMALKLDAEVVALTACQTGVGRNVSGEGVMGLGRAFEFAGAKRVLMSLWEVSEDSTTLLASQFFDYMKRGQDADTALLNARQDVRRKGYENPFYWAAFTLMGAGERPQSRMTIAANGPPKPVAPRQDLSAILSDLNKEAEAAKPPPPPPPPPPPEPKKWWELNAEYRPSPISLRDESYDFGRTSAAGVAAGYHTVAGGQYVGIAPFIGYELSKGDDVELSVTLGAMIAFTVDDPQSGDKGGTPRKRDWDEWRDYLKIINNAEINVKDVKLKLGRISDYELGSGALMRGYTNNLLADHTRVGFSMNYAGDVGQFDATLTDFGFQTTLLGAYAGIRPLRLANIDGIGGSLRVGVGYVGDFGAPATFKTSDGFATEVSKEFFPQYELRGMHGLSADLSITPIDFRFIRARVYGEFAQLIGLGNGITAGIDLHAPIPETGLGINARLEYRSLGSQYLPTYFDGFYEVQRYHFYSGDPTSAAQTKTAFTAGLLRAERAHSFWGDFNVGYGRYVGMGVTYETGGFANSSSITLHAQSQIFDYLTLFFTYQKRNFAQNSELFAFADNDLVTAYLRGNVTDWLQVYGRVTRSFTWDAAAAGGVGRMVGTWDASVALSIGYPLGKK